MIDERVKQLAEREGVDVEAAAAAVEDLADLLAAATVQEAAEAFRDNLDAAGPIRCDECHEVSDGGRWATLWGWSVAKFVGLAETIVDCRPDGAPTNRGALFSSIVAEVGEMILCPECGGAKHVPEIVPECITVRVRAGEYFEAAVAGRERIEIEIPAEVSAPQPPADPKHEEG